MSSQLNKVTICLIMTSLLVLMPHSGFLTNYGNHSIEIDERLIESYSSDSDSVWIDGGQPWPQPGRTSGRESTPPTHGPDGGAGLGTPENATELQSIVNPVINWQYNNYVYSTDAFATPIADLSESIISDDDSIERCGGDSLLSLIHI